MKMHAANCLSQISVYTGDISPLVCMPSCLIKPTSTPSPYFKLSIFAIDSSFQLLNVGWNRLVPTRALFRTMPRVAGIFCCSGILNNVNLSNAYLL